MFLKKFILIFLLLISTDVCADDMYDPIEPWNRSVFSFNETMDAYLALPVAKGYDFITPKPIQTGFKNFFSNLRYPQYLVSDLLQLDFSGLASHTYRLIVNSTIGLAGFIDVAKETGVKHKKADFGLALARMGVDSGPYIVIPFLGPSNLRDSIGLAVDSALYPPFWIGSTNKVDWQTAWAISSGVTVLEFINTRSSLIETIDTAKKSSLDYYLFMQSAYGQYRNGIILGEDSENLFAKDKELIEDNDFEDDDPFSE